MVISKCEPGMQVVYVPMHANGDIRHPDCDFGFITSIRNGTVFCRFWSKHSPGELRTKANSEGCDADMLEYHRSTMQSSVDELMLLYAKEQLPNRCVWGE